MLEQRIRHRAQQAPSSRQEEPQLLLAQYEHPTQQILPTVAPYFAVFQPPQVSLKKSNVFRADDHLSERLLGDVVIGCGVTAVVSPFLTVIDKALVQKSAGTHTVVGSMLGSVTSMLRNPVAYAKSPTFLWMWLTYAATYSVANSIKTITEHRDHVASSRAPRGRGSIGKNDALSTGAIFVGTTMANTTACLMKDRAYAKLFGNPAATRVPKISYAAWLLRDFSVIGSSFILPDHVAPLVRDTFGISDNAARHVAQVGTPMAAQLVAAPLHFFGLDCFNRDLSHVPNLTTRALDRSHFLARTFKDVALARMIRVLPGYGVAGVWNTQLRNRWRAHLTRKEVTEILDTNTYPANHRSHALL